MNTRPTFSALFASLLLSLAASTLSGCSSDSSNAAAPSYSCVNKGPCASDPVPSSTQASACMTLESDSICGSAFKTYSMCAYSAAQCGDGGLSDPTADSTSDACKSEYATYTMCLQNKINDAGASDAN